MGQLYIYELKHSSPYKLIREDNEDHHFIMKRHNERYKFIEGIKVKVLEG